MRGEAVLVLLVSVLVTSGLPAIEDGEERQEVNFLLKNISALWEEVNDLRQEVNHHLHQDHDESDHDNILRETGVLHHEHHVHHLRRPHESHNDHHDGELLDHLNTYHGHAQHQGHQESSDQNQQGESAEENDGEDDDGIDDDHDEGADDDDHSDHGDESHHTLGHVEDAHDHHGLHQDYDEYHEHGHEHGKEHGHGHERGHGHGHGGRGHGRGSHHHQHSEDGEGQSLGSPEAPERKPNDPWRRATCTLEPNAEMPSSDVRGSITISQRKDRKGPVYFDLDLTGFDVSLGRIHGFHVHEHSVRNNRCSTAGGHFNPYSETHGGPSSSTRHVGDLGNIEVEEDGELEGYIVSDNHVAFNGNSSIIGKAIVVHAGQDDLGLGGNAGSLTTGNAGGRLACCNIKRDRDFFFRFKG